MYWICNKGTVGKQTAPLLYVKKHMSLYPVKILSCFYYNVLKTGD